MAAKTSAPAQLKPAPAPAPVSPMHAITTRLNHQSLRLEQAVAGLCAISDLAGMISASGGRSFTGCDALDADNLAGLAATLATGIEVPLRDLDETISQLEHGRS